MADTQHHDALEIAATDQRFTARKIDLAGQVAGVVAASRLVLPGGDATSLVGWSIRESGGNLSAAFRLHDGGSSAGEVLANANLNAGESIRDLWYPWGIIVRTGRIWLEMTAGSIEGVLYYRCD